MHNFNPGDLALIVADGKPERIGKCVELVKLVQPEEWYKPPVECDLLLGMMHNASGYAVWLVIGDVSVTTYGGDHIQGFCQKCPTRLMPLRGDFKPDEDDLAQYADTSFYDLRTGRQRLVGGRA